MAQERLGPRYASFQLRLLGKDDTDDMAYFAHLRHFATKTREEKEEIVAEMDAVDEAWASAEEAFRAASEHAEHSGATCYYQDVGPYDEVALEEALELEQQVFHHYVLEMNARSNLDLVYLRQGYEESDEWLQNRGRFAECSTHIERLKRTLQDLREVCGVERKVRDDRQGQEMIDASARVRARYSMDSIGAEMPAGNWQLQTGAWGGGLSKGGIWLLADTAGRLVDRIAKKNDYQLEAHWITNAFAWHGDPKDAATREPVEWYFQNKCCDASPDHFVRIRAWAQDHKRFIITLYVEYCGHGDLAAVVKHHHREQTGDYIPEAALWMIFLRLIEAGLVMESGAVERTDAPKGWKVIVHRDLKPHNTFLDLPQANCFPRYPMPKIADFGLALETTEDDPLNPRIYAKSGAGTKSYRAPEQLGSISERKRKYQEDSNKMLGHTNVYGIGATMWNLMRDRRPYSDPSMIEPDTEVPATRWEYDWWTKQTYSEKLRDMVNRCVNWDPAERPTFQEMWEEIEREIETNPQDPWAYLKRARKGDQPDSPEHRMWFPEEKYKLSMASENPFDVLHMTGSPESVSVSEAPIPIPVQNPGLQPDYGSSGFAESEPKPEEGPRSSPADKRRSRTQKTV